MLWYLVRFKNVLKHLKRIYRAGVAIRVKASRFNLNKR